MTESAPGAGAEDVVAGVGMSRGATAAAILGALREVLGDRRISALATITQRAGEPGLREAAHILQVPLLAYTAAELSTADVPHPSSHALATLGTPSVAEAAAMLAGDQLVVPKTIVNAVVVAAATLRT